VGSHRWTAVPSCVDRQCRHHPRELSPGSRSVGGRSNAISRVPKPSFAKPMKGSTHMQSPHDRPPWTPQRTRALFRLFQTSAPPDFQRQLLERIAQRQHARGRRRMGWRSSRVWWPGGRAWSVGTRQPRRRRLDRVLATAGCGESSRQRGARAARRGTRSHAPGPRAFTSCGLFAWPAGREARSAHAHGSPSISTAQRIAGHGHSRQADSGGPAHPVTGCLNRTGDVRTCGA
jgi:hypothetical protein